MIARFIVLMSLAMPAMAGDISLGHPIDCDLENDCYIQQFVDHDPSEAASDFTCQGLSYDTHKGTDFALPSLARMREGVDVLASAGGTVKGTRNDMSDTGFSRETATYVEDRECGNGLVLDHGDGWETQYCHMKKGSVSVARGDVVAAGEVLGHVGYSGRTQFPHLHLSVRQDGKVVDPFDPDGVVCGEVETDVLWADMPEYVPGGLISAGISGNMPDYIDIKAGTVAQADTSSPALVVWAYGFGFRAGDVLEMRLTGPNGMVVSQEVALKKAQAQAFRAVGKKARGAWATGVYTGTIRFVRDGKLLDKTQVVLTAR